VVDGPIAGCLSPPSLPSGNDVDWSGGGTGLVARQIMSSTAQRVTRPMLRYRDVCEGGKAGVPNLTLF